MIDRRHLVLGGASALLAGQASAQTGGAYGFTFDALEGGSLALSQFAGRALIVVNTASGCGFTGQYSGLRDIDVRFRGAPLTIVGVPCNQFGEQEPGSSEDIRELCDGYRVEFPMAAKTDVVGPTRHPFYAWAENQIGASAVPRWNFHKIFVGRDGTAREALRTQVDPISPEFVAAVERALA